MDVQLRSLQPRHARPHPDHSRDVESGRAGERGGVARQAGRGGAGPGGEVQVHVGYEGGGGEGHDGDGDCAAGEDWRGVSRAEFVVGRMQRVCGRERLTDWRHPCGFMLGEIVCWCDEEGAKDEDEDAG